GSLDDQLVEIQGVVESAAYDSGGWSHVILRTQGGTLRVDLPGAEFTAEDLKRTEKSAVRIRGCFFAMVDPATNRLKPGQVRIYRAEITLEQADESDFFSTPLKNAYELMLFDPRASAFRRVKVAGQLLHARGAEHFMVDSTNGVRFIATPDASLEPGDLVEVAGFPSLGGAAPLLTEAIVRKTGHAPLPAAAKLEADGLMSVRHDSTLVSVEALLAGVRHTPTNLVMEMQSGSWRFLARLTTPRTAQPPLRIGSRLALTGVYVSQNRNLAPDESVVPFELLLNSGSDIAVLETPSWWTLGRLLVLVGVLAGVLVLAALWITQLRRQVEQRTAELAAQIKERRQAEQSRLLERERARIAQDLHDELGSGLTEISMLAARTSVSSANAEKHAGQLRQMTDKARELVTALDEIVWAMNPAHNSLSSLVSYFSLYADRFLGLAGIRWQLEDGTAAGDRQLDSHGRHQLFRAYKEALNNIVRHSGATEVRVGVQCVSNELRLVIADNGRGITDGASRNGGSGLQGMRSRIEKLGGRVDVTTDADRGTTVRFSVPTD
ncbi:MAG TPA: sensor histidine kinase, partial [Verrucomicrobiota bacterium]|nr:sensor histidine kinase [Verrucomicrobiota bacterium]